MIQPDDIRRKAENVYPRFLSAWLEGRPFFPKMIPARKQPGDSPAAAIQEVQQLRAGAKETLGYGYTVEWKEINSRKHGRNLFPDRIVFETQGDFLRYIGKQREFRAFAAAAESIRAQYPELIAWVRSHRKRLIENADDVEGMLLVVGYLRQNPRPQLFARELPLPLDTKFIERNKSVLRDWLDIALSHRIPGAIRSQETHFERRFGLRHAETQIFIRFLDGDLQRACGSPWPECSIPLHALAATPLHADRVLIVENKVNLLTLPPLAGSLAIGGLGDGVAELRDLHWLPELTIWYWGDLDVEGLAILSRIRALFPQTQSLFMDDAFLCHWRALVTPGTGRELPTPANLTKSELAAFVRCAEQNLRIEQEHVPHTFVVKSLQAKFGECDSPAIPQ